MEKCREFDFPMFLHTMVVDLDVDSQLFAADFVYEVLRDGLWK
jgi:hypothetical protein